MSVTDHTVSLKRHKGTNVSYTRRLIGLLEEHVAQPSPGRAGGDATTSNGGGGGGDAATGDRPVLIRVARDGDLPRLRDLAELDGARPLPGPVLIAFVEDEAWAAVSLAEGRVVADPFRPSAAAVALLRMRAAQLEGEPTGRRPAISRRPVWRRARA